MTAPGELAESGVYKVNGHFGSDFKAPERLSGAYGTGGLVVNSGSLLLRSGRVAADSSVPLPAARVPFFISYE